MIRRKVCPWCDRLQARVCSRPGSLSSTWFLHNMLMHAAKAFYAKLKVNHVTLVAATEMAFKCWRLNAPLFTSAITTEKNVHISNMDWFWRGIYLVRFPRRFNGDNGMDRKKCAVPGCPFFKLNCVHKNCAINIVLYLTAHLLNTLRWLSSSLASFYTRKAG